MADNGLNSTRALWAAQYQSAPRKRLHTVAGLSITVPAATTLDITAQCPLKSDCGDAPCYDMLVTGVISELEAGLIGVGMSHDAAVIPTVPQYPYVGEEETEGIRVRNLSPRAATADTVLDTPMVTAAGVAVPNKVYLINGHDQTEAVVQVVFEIPDLNWV